jgi:hypothetical protein
MAATFSWLNAVLLVAIALPMVGDRGAVGVALAKIVSGIVVAVFIWAGITRVSEVTGKAIVARLWRPVVASGFMAVAVVSVAPSGSGVLGDLLLRVSVGVVSYCAALLLVWRLAGCPDGAERFFLSHLSRRFER